jgi:hypothetical protein
MRTFYVAVTTDKTIARWPGIERDGKLWLATLVSANPSKGLMRLDRLVRFDKLRHQVLSPPVQGMAYAVNVPIPKALFDLDLPQTGLDDYEIEDDAEIEVPVF